MLKARNQSRSFHCHFAHTRAFSLLSPTYCVKTKLRWRLTKQNYLHEGVIHIHHQTWIAQGRFMNIIRTLSKQWGMCDKCINVLWVNNVYIDALLDAYCRWFSLFYTELGFIIFKYGNRFWVLLGKMECLHAITVCPQPSLRHFFTRYS